MNSVNNIAIGIFLIVMNSQPAQSSCDASVTIGPLSKEPAPRLSLEGCEVKRVSLQKADLGQLKALRGMVTPVPKIFVDTKHIGTQDVSFYSVLDALNVTRAEIYWKFKVTSLGFKSILPWQSTLETDLNLLGTLTGLPLLGKAYFMQPLERPQYLSIFAIVVGGIRFATYSLPQIPYTSATDWFPVRAGVGLAGFLLPVLAAIFSNIDQRLKLAMIAAFGTLVLKRVTWDESPHGMIACFERPPFWSTYYREVYSNRYEQSDFPSTKLSGFCESVFQQGEKQQKEDL